MEREQRPRFPASGEKRDRFRFTLRASFPNGCPRHFDPGYRDRRNQENVEKIMSQDEQPTTITAYLRPIDREGLLAFAKRGRDNPDRQGTNVVHTVCEGQYRTLSYVGDHDPVVVDEPQHLFGQDTAPAPGEIALSGLGGCLAVGITAVATFRNVRLSRLELRIEGDVGNTAAWGAGGATRTLPDGLPGYQGVGRSRRRRDERGAGGDRQAGQLLLSCGELDEESDSDGRFAFLTPSVAKRQSRRPADASHRLLWFQTGSPVKVYFTSQQASDTRKNSTRAIARLNGRHGMVSEAHEELLPRGTFAAVEGR